MNERDMNNTSLCMLGEDGEYHDINTIKEAVNISDFEYEYSEAMRYYNECYDKIKKINMDKVAMIMGLNIFRMFDKGISYKNTKIGKYIYLANSSNKRISKKNLKKIEKICYTTEEK